MKTEDHQMQQMINKNTTNWMKTIKEMQTLINNQINNSINRSHLKVQIKINSIKTKINNTEQTINNNNNKT